MRQFRTTVIALSALGLLSWVQGSPLSAQSQSQPQTMSCPLEGPSITDALAYINSTVSPWRVSFDDQTITIVPGETGIKATAPIYALNCAATGRIAGSSYAIQAVCLSGKCATIFGPLNPPNGLQIDELDFSFEGDSERGDRLVRAFSHLIALLQQKYKQSHSSPNDPFAKPQ
jgi:hypothetical protein